MSARQARRQFGVTLSELLFTLLLTAVILVFGVPAFTGLMANVRMSHSVNTLIGHLQFARSEAIKRGRDRVAIGPYQNDLNWLNSQSWGGGYLVAIVDSATPPGILKALRRVDGSELEAFTVQKNGNSPRFFFSPDGSASGDGTLTVCERRNPSHRRGVIVDPVGRARVSDFKPGGDPLTCD